MLSSLIRTSIVLGIALAAVVSTGAVPASAAGTSALTVAPRSVLLVAGRHQQLSLHGKPTASWPSSAESIAAVSKQGLVTARRAGVARITARVGSQVAVTQVIVKPSPFVKPSHAAPHTLPPAPPQLLFLSGSVLEYEGHMGGLSIGYCEPGQTTGGCAAPGPGYAPASETTVKVLVGDENGQALSEYGTGRTSTSGHGYQDRTPITLVSSANGMTSVRSYESGTGVAVSVTTLPGGVVQMRSCNFIVSTQCTGGLKATGAAVLSSEGVQKSGGSPHVCGTDLCWDFSGVDRSHGWDAGLTMTYSTSPASTVTESDWLDALS